MNDPSNAPPVPATAAASDPVEVERLRTEVAALRGRLATEIAVFAYLAGPGRLPMALRQYLARGVRWVATTTHSVTTGPQLRIWAHRYFDALRIVGVVIAAVVALAFSSWTALLVILVVLIGFEVLITMLARSGEELDKPTVTVEHPA